ncbi:alpha/beta hydrolase [Microbacterium sp. NPDC055988]|uniref:alpha/beta hydrolase n=1 Tax=Microbacterium sp. NPDC055988 TaxID=3345671 RepID=UPI0035D66243
MNLPGLIDDPTRGDVGTVSGYATTFSTRAGSSRERKGDADAALASITSMTASSADALGARVVLLSQRFGEAAEGLDGISTAISAYATDLEGLKSEAARRLRAAQNAYDHIFVRRAEALSAASEFVTGWALPWDAVLPSWMYVDDPSYLRRWQDAIDDYYTARASYNTLAEERTAIDQRAVNAIAAVPLISSVTQGGKVGGAGFAAASLAWAGNVNAITAESLAGLGDPDIIRETWNTMDQATRDALLAASPMILGNLNGIPIRDRVTANHTNIRDEIARREAEIARLQEKLDVIDARNHWSAQRRKSLSDEIAQLREPIGYWKSLLEQDYEWRDEWNAPQEEKKAGARVVVFDPAADAIATYHGPIDPLTGDIPKWIRNVAVSVPGTATSMTAFGDSTARNLYQAAGYETAVFQWAGGSFPQLELPGPTDASFSKDLAPRLVDFVSAIREPSESALTVLGYSYGGATVGLAETAGLAADRVLYVSAAGMGAGVSGIGDFPNTSAVPHYSMMARDDLVVGLIQGNGPGQMHGQSPLTADGVTRLETGWIQDERGGRIVDLEDFNIEGNGTPRGIDSHSSVYDPRSVAFDNIIAVITGGDAMLYAPDEVYNPRPIVVPGAGPVIQAPMRTDGIDKSDFEPEYVRIDG